MYTSASGIQIKKTYPGDKAVLDALVGLLVDVGTRTAAA